MKVPRGIRNNNPLNIIRTKTVWMGMAKEQRDKKFVTFEKMEYGWRAAFVLLTRTYYRKYHLDTIRKIITRWAPAADKASEGCRGTCPCAGAPTGSSPCWTRWKSFTPAASPISTSRRTTS